MRIKVKFKANTDKIEFIMNSHINGFVNNVLGKNNKWHGLFSPYCVSKMYGGVLQEDKTIQYPNGGYFIVSSSNNEFVGDFLNGLLSLKNGVCILSMEFDSYDIYEPTIMSDYTIVHFENIYLHKNSKGEEDKVYTYKNCEDYLEKLKKNTVDKLIKEGIPEMSAESIKFIPFHTEKWKEKFCKYKMIENHHMVHPTSDIYLVVTGSKKARKTLCEMGIGNSTGYGFGFARLKEDNQ